MSTPHDGSNAFPTLRDYLAAHETLSDVDVTTGMAELLAGEPMPKRSDSLAWLCWDAKWKAALRYIRADAMLEVRGAGTGASSEVERMKAKLDETEQNRQIEIATNDAMRKQCVDELVRRQKAEEQAARLKAALDKILHHHSGTALAESMDLRRMAQDALQKEETLSREA